MGPPAVGEPTRKAEGTTYSDCLLSVMGEPIWRAVGTRAIAAIRVLGNVCELCYGDSYIKCLTAEVGSECKAATASKIRKGEDQQFEDGTHAADDALQSVRRVGQPCPIMPNVARRCLSVALRSQELFPKRSCNLASR
jgi:hypothetical protein